MNGELTKHLKAAMEYVEVPVVRCEGCIHALAQKDQAGMNVWTCRLNPAAPLHIHSYGRCKHHHLKSDEIAKRLENLKRELGIDT